MRSTLLFFNFTQFVILERYQFLDLAHSAVKGLNKFIPTDSQQILLLACIIQFVIQMHF